MSAIYTVTLIHPDHEMPLKLFFTSKSHAWDLEGRAARAGYDVLPETPVRACQTADEAMETAKLFFESC